MFPVCKKRNLYVFYILKLKTILIIIYQFFLDHKDMYDIIFEFYIVNVLFSIVIQTAIKILPNKIKDKQPL